MTPDDPAGLGEGLQDPVARQEPFRRELLAWCIRATVLSLPSVTFAAAADFFGPLTGVLGILTGLGACIVLLARLTSLESMQQTAVGQRVLNALRRAAWFKGTWGALGAVAHLLQYGVGLTCLVS